MNIRQDRELLQMALIGFEIRRQKIQEDISEIQGRLKAQDGNPPAITKTEAAPSQKRRIMSAAARRRIADAQKRRWAKRRSQAKAEARTARKVPSLVKKRAAPAKQAIETRVAKRTAPARTLTRKPAAKKASAAKNTAPAKKVSRRAAAKRSPTKAAENLNVAAPPEAPALDT